MSSGVWLRDKERETMPACLWTMWFAKDYFPYCFKTNVNISMVGSYFVCLINFLLFPYNVSCFVLCTEACAAPFSLVTAVSFSQPKTKPCVTTASVPTPIRRQSKEQPKRQPKEQPKVLLSSAEGNTDSVPDCDKAQRQQCASNASVSSVSCRRPAGGSISSLSHAPLNAGL